MSRKIFLSAGHGGKDSGAVGNGYVEKDLTIELRNLIARELKALGIVPSIDDDRNALSQTLAWLRGKFKSIDILLDIHWNAASSAQAKGSEVIIPDSASQFEKELARALLKVFVDLGFKDRGVKPEALTARKKLGWMRPHSENVLIEVCFISNAVDMKLYEANKNNIAKRIASVLNQYSKLP
jgi:N-acetylmuramoyl-L-alanine amidase